MFPAFKADKRRFTIRLQDVRSLNPVFFHYTPELKIELSYSQNSFCLAFSVQPFIIAYPICQNYKPILQTVRLKWQCISEVVRTLQQNTLRNNITESRCIQPSYQNESSDSVTRKPLDGFKNAFNTKQIFIFGDTFVSSISLNSTIYSTILFNLSICMPSSSSETELHQFERQSRGCCCPFVPLLPFFSSLLF